jgi:hypothetical protein
LTGATIFSTHKCSVDWPKWELLAIRHWFRSSSHVWLRLCYCSQRPYRISNEILWASRNIDSLTPKC